jgi:hypothetical protein
MRALRAVLLAVGVGAAAYGVWRLLDLGWENTRATVTWLVGGVVLHDGVFAPLVLVAGLVAVQLVPRRHLAPVVVILVVLVPVTLAGIPELGRYGARADRPTLLDRDYWLGWWVMVTLVVATVAVGASSVARRRMLHARGGDRGQGDGGRRRSDGP